MCMQDCYMSLQLYYAGHGEVTYVTGLCYYFNTE